MDGALLAVGALSDVLKSKVLSGGFIFRVQGFGVLNGALLVLGAPSDVLKPKVPFRVFILGFVV